MTQTVVRSGVSGNVSGAPEETLRNAEKYPHLVKYADPVQRPAREIVGREVECAVLGNEEAIASNVGEIKSAEEFYSFDAKYKNQESRTLIPAEISKENQEKIRKLAIKAFTAIDGKGLSRVDFFVEDKTEEIYLNEINTLPGFTRYKYVSEVI